jgi:hypothetical protein
LPAEWLLLESRNKNGLGTLMLGFGNGRMAEFWTRSKWMRDRVLDSQWMQGSAEQLGRAACRASAGHNMTAPLAPSPTTPRDNPGRNRAGKRPRRQCPPKCHVTPKSNSNIRPSNSFRCDNLE